MAGRNTILLDVDPSILEKNLMLEELKTDELDSLISSISDQPSKTANDKTPWKLVKPSPGFVLKTKTDSGEKIFLNICHTEDIPAPQDISDSKLIEIMQSDSDSDSDDPSDYRLPMSIGDLHEEPDKSGKPSLVYDIAINSTFFRKVETNQLFRSFVQTLAMEGVSNKYNKLIDTNDFVIMKNRKVMGSLQYHRIQQGITLKKTLIEEVKSNEQHKEKPTFRPQELKNDELDSLISSINDQPSKTANDKTPWKLVKPSPGFVLKTKTDSGEKIFLNICHTEDIIAPQDISDAKLIEIMQSDDDDPSDYRLPMSIGDLHEEPDKSGKPSLVYDIAINSTFFRKVETNQLFRSFVQLLAMEGVSNKYNKLIDTNDFVIMKNRKVMGSLQYHRIQQRGITLKKTLIEEVKSNEQHKEKPTFRIIREPPHGDPQMLTVQVYVKDVSSGKTLLLDVGEDRLVLRSARKAGSLLDIFLPFSVDQDATCAHFDLESQILSVELPVINPVK